MLSAYKKIDQDNKQKFDQDNEQKLSSRVSPEEYGRLRDSVLHLNSISWLHNARARVEKYQSQTENMRNSCISVQESVGCKYKVLLDMKQKQANVAEASLSRLSAEVASEQNRAIMIFTIFTIIFVSSSFSLY
jgi:2-keto-4-pentenoate hydratase